MFHVYFLLLSNSDIYKGITDNLKRRYSEHSNGKVKSTKNFRPLELIGYEAYVLKSDAMRREKFLKTTGGRKLLRLQYKNIIEKYKTTV
ncbi:MAG: GIY-YIG nuclease family protein [Candidatus Portnoybacteria bacterium]|nr:GIY-YIG nuclease family protein [Candidatus Portnoybacteria bacterium]